MSEPQTKQQAAILSAARSYIGTPYQHQASLKGVGCDCLGLLRGIWRAVMGAEPESFSPYSPDWAESHQREDLLEAAGRHFLEISPEAARAGDVLIFRWRAHLPAKHLGIIGALAPHKTLIHAHEGAGVVEVPLGSHWQRHIAGAFCFPVRH